MRIPPIILLFFIPALIALGHDGYIFYMDNLNPGTLSLDLLLTKFKFISLGHIWTHYGIESYKMVRESVSVENWALIESLLEFKAVHVGLVLGGVLTLFFMLLGIFKIGPLSHDKHIANKGQFHKVRPKFKK